MNYVPPSQWLAQVTAPEAPPPPRPSYPDEPHATIDWETYSHAGLYLTDDGKYVSMHGSNKPDDKGLRGVGAAVYAQHPSTEILTLSYRLPGGPLGRWRPGLPPPTDLWAWIAAGGLVEAHNVMFERLIWHYVATPRHGFPPVPPGQWRCSMAKARVNALPGALGDLTAVLATPVVKDADGKRLLDKFSVPRKPTKTDPRLRIRPEDDPHDAERLYGYCDTDVESEELASAAMLPMTPDEIAFWQVDQEINWRGVGVDLEGVRACRVILEQVFEKYGDEFQALTGGLSPTQVQALTGWLSAKGVHTASLDADAIEALLDGDLPDDARRALEIRQLTGSASVKKLYSMERMATAEGRLCNLYAHHGARTGRPTGQDCQPTNLPKAGPAVRCCAGCGHWAGASLAVCPWCGVPRPPSDKPTPWDADAVEDVLEIMRTGSVDMVEMFYGDALLAISGCIRSLFVAAPGHDLIASDYSAIEAVTLAALAGEEWRLETFRQGIDIYLAGASKITGRPVQFYLDYKRDNGVHHPDRQKIGKVSELACFAPDTQVLTDRGYVAIVDVTTDDRLWDGVEWVRHHGPVAKGIAGTIRLDGVEMTPDHKVLCGTSWQEARQLVLNVNTHSLARETGSGNLPSFLPKVRKSLSVALAGPNPTRFYGRTSDEVNPRDATNARNANRAAHRSATNERNLIKNNIGFMRTFALTTLTDAVCLTVSRLASLVAAPMATRITAGEVSAFTPSGWRTAAGSWPTFSHLMDGTILLWNWTASKLTAITNLAISDSSLNRATPKINDRSRPCSGESMNLRPVYDIAHAGPRNRFTIRTDTGHLIVHNCGYQGWIGAYRAFGAEGTDDEIKAQILAWRAASPNIVEFWGGQGRGFPGSANYRPELYGIEGAFIGAVQNPGLTTYARSLSFRYDQAGDFLHMTLPSGRYLTYHTPRLVPSEKRAGELSITYMTWNSNPKYGPRGWICMNTWGGRLAENANQAVAHDIQRYGILALRATGYPTVLHVYDEDVVEVPEGFGSVEEVEQIMGQMPPWAEGWPIKASGGYRAKRYRKG